MTEKPKTMVRHPGDCQWCSADFGRWGRTFGSILVTAHALRHHRPELGEVADGTDPEEVPPMDDG